MHCSSPSAPRAPSRRPARGAARGGVITRRQGSYFDFTWLIHCFGYTSAPPQKHGVITNAVPKQQCRGTRRMHEYHNNWRRSIAAYTAVFAAALAGILSRLRVTSDDREPPSSAAASAAQPASVTWVFMRLSSLSFVSTPVGGDSAPAGGGGGATRAARPSSPKGLPKRLRCSSAGRRRKAGARATSPASPKGRWSARGS